MKKKILRVFLVIFIYEILSCPNVFAQLNITLSQAIELTLQNNLQIKQAKFKEEISSQNLDQAKYNRLPNLVFTPQSSINWGRSLDVSTYNYLNQKVLLGNGNLGAQLPISQGRQLSLQVLQNKILLDEDKTYTSKIKNDLILNVMTTFLEVLNFQDQLKASKQQISLATLILLSIKKGFAAGNKTVADLAQSKAQLSIVESNFTDINNQLDAATLNLKQLMELNPKSSVELMRPDISSIIEYKKSIDTITLYEQVLNINPDVKIAELQVRSSLENIKLVKSNFFPSIYLSGSLGSNFSNARSLPIGSRFSGFDTIGIVSGSPLSVISPRYVTVQKKYSLYRQLTDNFYQTLILNLQIPIFSRFSNKIALTKAKINLQSSEINFQQVKNNLHKIIYQAVLDFKAATAKLESTGNNFEYTREAFNATDKRFKIGLVNIIDYTTSLNNLNKSEFDLIQSKYNLIYRRKVIDYYLGKPISL